MRTLLLLAALALPTHAAYQYAVTDQYSSPAGSWTTNGTLQWYVHGLSGIGSRILFSPAVGSEHEVRTVLNPSCSTTYFHYLRATQDANILTPAGTFYAVELQPTCSPGQPTTVRIYKRHNGTLTLLAQGSAALNSGDVVRSLYRNGAIHAYINADFYLSAADTAISSGQSGVGSNQYTAGGMTIVQLGAADTVAPSAPDAQKVSISTRPTQIDLQWAGAPDDANGIGVRAYRIYRNGVQIQSTRTPEFTDTTVSPSTTYNYGIQTLDWHRNVSSTTTIAVTTAPPNHVDPQRIGVNSLGTYWGAAGEQIDLRSGNLNFTLPLITAVGRGNTSIPFSLNYNSQLWRQEGTTVFRQGRDIGYGFGWRLLAGSITPAWSDYFTIHHWVFTDSTGAEYRLDVNTSGKWTSREGFYGTFDANQNILYFNDGTHWFMGAESAGAEEDAGTRYPTTIRDANGNQIFVRYRTGVSAPWTGSSGRIDEIEDARAKLVGSVRRTFAFSYLNERLSAITNEVGSAQAYTFHVLPASLTEPFTQATFPATTNLTAVTQSGTSLTHSFTYYGTTGELQRADLPFGGYLKWEYRPFTYLGARTLREVQYRYIRYSASAPEYQYEFIRDDTADQNLTYHNYTLVREPNNGPTRKYWFAADSSWGAPFGYLYWLDRATSLYGGTVTALETYSWTTDSANRPYIWATNHVLDPYDGAKKITSRVEQSLDADGNLVWRKLYDYGTSGNAATTPNRTYNYSYITSSTYRDRYLRGLLSSSTVTGVGGTYNLASIQYDQTSLSAAASNPLYQHDSANYGTGFTTRGNPTTITRLGVTSTAAYDITGVVRTATGGGTSAELTPSMNNMVPGIIKPNGSQTLQESITYNDNLQPTSVQGPNGANETQTYTATARPESITNAHGKVTNLTYDDGAGTTTAKDGGWLYTNEGYAKKWVKTYRDSFGRTTKIETGKEISGGATTTTSIAETVYEPCACNPLGKAKKTSLPYAPGGTPVWTVYTYDSLGRTISVAHAGGMGTTTTAYAGVADASNPQRFKTTTTDPATKWKEYYTNGLGELVKVVEPGTLATSYDYNALGKLTTVTMPRGAVTQTRSFTYNANGQLTASTNPENGTVTQTYLATGQPSTKTDAKNNKEVYTYDGFARLISIHRYTNLTTPAGVDYFYFDATPGGGNYSQNAAGRLAQRETALTTDASGQAMKFIEDFSYTVSGLPTNKRLTVYKETSQGSRQSSLEASYGYDGEGGLLSMTYPSSHVPAGGGVYNPVTGVQAVYGRNALSQMNSLTVGGQSVVTSAYYNTAGQLQQLNWDGWTEDRWYNTAGQMWKQQIKAGSTVIGGWEYYFPASGNNGRITGTKDLQSLEEITYQYDSRNRLVNATKTGGGWAETYVYDGFGNLTTKGASSWLVDTATNRLHSSTGATYDNNGNLTGLSGGVSFTHDTANRVTTANPTGEKYRYTTDNRRVYKYRPGWGEEITFWGPTGRLATYRIDTISNGTMYFVEQTRNVWFGSRLLRTGPAATPTKLATDRLGSIRLRQTGTNPIEYLTYAPYGEQRTGPAGEGEKFATYYRDQTGLDYADQRYFSNSWGRFLSVDPARDGRNWYSYGEGDPANAFDPRGLESIKICDISPNSPGCSILPMCHAYPFMPICKDRAENPPVPDCYRPEMPKGEDVDRNIREVKDVAQYWQDVAATALPEEPGEGQLAALLISHVWLIHKVQPKGDWDYKHHFGPSFEDAGNFNYGAVSAALQIPYYVAQNFAGGLNVLSNGITMAEKLIAKVSGEKVKMPEWWIHGIPLIREPYGDDTKDAKAINAGHGFYHAKQAGTCK